jgi:hypothetical protein
VPGGRKVLAAVLALDLLFTSGLKGVLYHPRVVYLNVLAMSLRHCLVVPVSGREAGDSSAVPAGAGNSLVGLLALPVALLLASPARGARGVAVAWNVLGILDLVDAVTLNALTTPGGLQIVPDRVDLVAAFPLVLIPAFGVPLSVMLHSLSLRQLRRLGRRNVTGLPLRTDQLASPLAAQHG